VVATVSSLDTNRETITTTDDQGRFRVAELQPGAYRVKISVQYFNPYVVENTLLEVGRVTMVDASLSLPPEDLGTVIINNTPVITTFQLVLSAT
jgi:hypothetical protein